MGGGGRRTRPGLAILGDAHPGPGEIDGPDGYPNVIAHPAGYLWAALPVCRAKTVLKETLLV